MAIENLGLYIPTTQVWDIRDLFNGPIDNDAIAELIVRLYQNINVIANTVNLKTSGMFPLTEFVTGDTFFPNPALTSATPQTPTPRPVIRIVVDFGALPNAGTKVVPHNIDSADATVIFTKIYATATDPVAVMGIPIPFASPVLADNIAVWADALNVNITTGSDRTMFTTCYVVVEYIIR